MTCPELMPRIAIWLWPGPRSATVKEAMLRDRSTRFWAPELMIRSWLVAETEKGTFCRFASRLVAVTITSCSIAPGVCSCCAFTTTGTAREQAIVTMGVRRLISFERVDDMTILPPERGAAASRLHPLIRRSVPPALSGYVMTHDDTQGRLFRATMCRDVSHAARAVVWSADRRSGDGQEGRSGGRPRAPLRGI